MPDPDAEIRAWAKSEPRWRESTLRELPSLETLHLADAVIAEPTLLAELGGGRDLSLRLFSRVWDPGAHEALADAAFLAEAGSAGGASARHRSAAPG